MTIGFDEEVFATGSQAEREWLHDQQGFFRCAREQDGHGILTITPGELEIVTSSTRHNFTRLATKRTYETLGKISAGAHASQCSHERTRVQRKQPTYLAAIPNVFSMRFSHLTYTGNVVARVLKCRSFNVATIENTLALRSLIDHGCKASQA